MYTYIYIYIYIYIHICIHGCFGFCVRALGYQCVIHHTPATCAVALFNLFISYFVRPFCCALSRCHDIVRHVFFLFASDLLLSSGAAMTIAGAFFVFCFVMFVFFLYLLLFQALLRILFVR